MKVIPNDLLPNNLPLVQVPKGFASKCTTKKPNGYIPSDTRVVAIHRLEAIRATYSLLVRGKFRDPRSSVRSISPFPEDSSIPVGRLTGPHMGDVQLGLITEYNNLAERLMRSYTFDICQDAKRQGLTVSPNKVLESLSKTHTPPKKGVKGAVIVGSVGEHLTDKKHRFYGLPESSVIQLAIKEAKKGSFLTKLEIDKAFGDVKLAERDLAEPSERDIAKSEVAKDSDADADNDKNSDLSWYNNPWIIATLSIGATVGVHHIVKRSRS